MKAITPHLQAMDLTMAPGRITEEAQSSSQLAIGRTIVDPGIGTVARIIFGGLVTGRGGTGSTYGSVVITLCEDTEVCAVRHPCYGKRLPSRNEPTNQAEKSANERFRKVVTG